MKIQSHVIGMEAIYMAEPAAWIGALAILSSVYYWRQGRLLKAEKAGSKFF